jgi:hypothetical protein
LTLEPFHKESLIVRIKKAKIGITSNKGFEMQDIRSHQYLHPIYVYCIFARNHIQHPY